MHLDDIPLRFQRLAGKRELSYSLAAPASDDEMLSAERRLGISFPAQVELFYRSFNGLQVDDPPLEVLPVEHLNFASNRLHFATLDGSHPLYFDVSRTNEAEQWDIVSADEYQVTLSMASFWSNKIWVWVEKRRAIWQEWEDEAAT